MLIDAPEKTYTAEEYMRLAQSAEYEGRMIELVDGRIVEMAGGGSGKHGETISEVTFLLLAHVKQHKLGRTTGAETGYILDMEAGIRPTVRCPDFAFVSYARAPQPLGEGFVPFAPDLAVEVVSPGNDAEEIHSKVRAFLNAGTRAVWVVYPKSQTVVVHTANTARTYEATETLEGGDVLPGFSVTVGDLFPK